MDFKWGLHFVWPDLCIIHFEDTSSPQSHRAACTNAPWDARTPLLILFFRHDSLMEIKVGHRVCEFLDFLDLEVPVCVGIDVADIDRFAVRLHPDRGLRLAGDL